MTHIQQRVYSLKKPQNLPYLKVILVLTEALQSRKWVISFIFIICILLII